MDSHPSLTYYDKVLHQKFHPLYTIFALLHLAAIACYVRRNCKGHEKVFGLPIAFFSLRLVDLLLHFGPDYHEAEIITANMALIPLSILMAKYISFLPRYNDFPLSSDNKKSIFGVKEAKQFMNNVKLQYKNSLTPLSAFIGGLLIIMAFRITILFVINFFLFLSYIGCFTCLLMITMEVRLAKETRIKANFIVSGLLILGLVFGLKVVLPWRWYADTLYSLFFSVQYLAEISIVFLVTHIMTRLMQIKYIVYV